MSRKLLKIRTYGIAVLIIAFFIGLSIFLILLTQGKQIGTDGSITQTGIIKIKSLPDNPDATINGKDVNISSKQIKNIELGEVTLTLSKDGYTSWQKNLVVESDRITRVFAQLYPVEKPVQEKLSDLNVDQINYPLSDKTESFFTVINDSSVDNNGLWSFETNPGILDFNKDEVKKNSGFSTNLAELLKNNAYTFQVSEDSKKTLFIFQDLNKIYILDNNSEIESDFTSSLGFYPVKIQWFKNSSSILIEDKNILYEFNTSSNESKVVFFNPIEHFNYTVSNQTVYFWDKTVNELKQYKNGNIEAIEKLTTEIDLTNGIKNLYSPTAVPNIVIIQTDKGLYYIDTEEKLYTLISETGTFLQVSPTGKNVIYKDSELNYVFHSNDVIIKSDGIKNYKNEPIIMPDNTDFAFSGSDYTLLTYLTESSLNSNLSLADYDGANPYSLITDTNFEISDIFLNESNETVYLLLENSLNEKILHRYDLTL